MSSVGTAHFIVTGNGRRLPDPWARLRPNTIADAATMPRALMRPKAIARLVRSMVLGWLRTRVNLAKLNALDSRTLKDIGLNRTEFHAAADPDTPFERPNQSAANGRAR